MIQITQISIRALSIILKRAQSGNNSSCAAFMLLYKLTDGLTDYLTIIYSLDGRVQVD